MYLRDKNYTPEMCNFEPSIRYRYNPIFIPLTRFIHEERKGVDKYRKDEFVYDKTTKTGDRAFVKHGVFNTKFEDNYGVYLMSYENSIAEVRISIPRFGKDGSYMFVIEPN
ncbi:hypothetical protein HZS_7959 [Henneguya salminicola]|nr:hypothetical protein HZS_7959 [Henneguya salminicola]